MLEYAASLDPKSKPTAVVRKGGATGGAAGPGKKEESWRDLPVEKRIEYALIKGIDEFAVVDTEEARSSGRWGTRHRAVAVEPRESGVGDWAVWHGCWVNVKDILGTGTTPVHRVCVRLPVCWPGLHCAGIPSRCRSLRAR